MAKRRTFFSFHYKPDNWRAAKVRNMGVVEGNSPVSDNDWETVTGGGETAIKRWIDGQMYGKSCVIVLIGSQTSGRKWIKYEIEKAWTTGEDCWASTYTISGITMETSRKKALTPSTMSTRTEQGSRLS